MPIPKHDELFLETRHDSKTDTIIGMGVIATVVLTLFLIMFVR